MISIKDNYGNDIIEEPTFEEGINTIKDIFRGLYNIQLFKNRFLGVNKKWGKNPSSKKPNLN